MKKIYKAAVLLLAAMFLLSGCRKNDSADSASSVPVSEISAETEESAAEESEESLSAEEEAAEAEESLSAEGEAAEAEESLSAEEENVEPAQEEAGESEATAEVAEEEASVGEESASEEQVAAETQTVDVAAESSVLSWNDGWTYASNSAIHSDTVTLYRAQTENRKNITVAINAGHGTSGGSSVQTLCHPDGSAKVTGGSTAAGSTTATAVSGGTSFLDGTSEASATLSLARIAKDRLLAAGYDVLMIRETDNCQLDNIARTVFANQYANCHISLHYDSTESNKGVFYCSVPDVASYRSMEPVASHWQQHIALGEAVISGMSAQGNAIYGSGSMALDLTQTSYSTVPSIDLEVGDRASDHSQSAQERLADGIVAGVNLYFGY